MKKNEFGAFILSETKNGDRIVSCGGRISTREGTAVELYKKATDKEKNLNLINKVVASGHTTVLEHHYFNLAFNNVSVFVEQFLIEFRLASFTIKSGRYVNFSKSGYNLSDEFSDSQKNLLKTHYKNMFNCYDELVANGIPIEDARFVLPYGIKTNIYMSVNARELVHIICSMIYGQGSKYDEIKKLGTMLKTEMDKRYPDLISINSKKYINESKDLINITNKIVGEISFETNKVAFLGKPIKDARNKVNEIAKFCGYDEFDFNLALKDNKLSKMLEHFEYSFVVKDFALIILKHFARHRMQSLSTMPLVKMAQVNKFVMPESIKSNKNSRIIFEDALKENREIYNKLVEDNVNPYLLVYVMPHSTAIDFVSTINARELLHFFNLRTCNRAQWEIRNLATKMLAKLKKNDPEMFEFYGPSCFTFGVCPEGRLCCGKQMLVKEKFKNLQNL